MSVDADNLPLSFYGQTPVGFPPLARVSVEQYQAMIASGALDENDRLELIEGALVAKMTKNPGHSTGSELCGETIRRLLPAGWHVRIEKPVRIPARDSMPEPDISVVRGGIRDYARRDPNPDEVGLIIEVSDSTVRADRALAATYLGGGISTYWLVNIPDRQLEIYTVEAFGPVILGETAKATLILAGQAIGHIAVADLLPPA